MDPLVTEQEIEIWKYEQTINTQHGIRPGE